MVILYLILKGIKKHYETHHGVVIPDEMLETAITMSQRYINDRFMPDKVIDIIDEASKIFCGMKKKYENITSEDDYLQCTLLALNDKKWCSIESDMDSIMERIKKLKDFSLNERMTF